MREDAVERPGYAAQIERLDQRRRKPDLPVGQEPAELFLGPSRSMRGLLLVGAKRSEDPVRREDRLDGWGAEATDQLVLQIRLAHIEPEPFHPGATHAGT